MDRYHAHAGMTAPGRLRQFSASGRRDVSLFSCNGGTNSSCLSGPLFGQSTSALPESPAISPLWMSRRVGSTGLSTIQIELQFAELWRKFFSAGTEMIVTKTGRRMYPDIAVCISGLENEARYSVVLEIPCVDHLRYKHIKSTWMALGKSEVTFPETEQFYEHSRSPNTGASWMREVISFKKVKLTNNERNKKAQFVLHTMHKYQPRVKILKESHDEEGKFECVFTKELELCAFISVTAYQNDEITQLKIKNNPFARAFRRTSHIEGKVFPDTRPPNTQKQLQSIPQWIPPVPTWMPRGLPFSFSFSRPTTCPGCECCNPFPGGIPSVATLLSRGLPVTSSLTAPQSASASQCSVLPSIAILQPTPHRPPPNGAFQLPTQEISPLVGQAPLGHSSLSPFTPCKGPTETTIGAKQIMQPCLLPIP